MLINALPVMPVGIAPVLIPPQRQASVTKGITVPLEALSPTTQTTYVNLDIIVRKEVPIKPNVTPDHSKVSRGRVSATAVLKE